MKLSLIICLVVGLSGCKIKVSVYNNSPSKFDSINVFVAAAKYNFKEIDSGEGITLSKYRKSIKGGSDGQHVLTTYKRGISKSYIFGYYSNGYPSEDSIQLFITDSSLNSNMKY
jgi:hypothetical protein